MSIKTIDVELLAKMFLAGAQNIDAKKEYINELNVFPVPDGDTGTNMSLTIMMAAKEVKAMDKLEMGALAKVISSGSLRGARGNSGVILSQLLRGFTKVIRDKEEIDVETLAAACQKASDTAYKAVMKPKEGTILTVARGIAEKAAEMAQETEELEVFIPAVIDHAQEVLDKTPELLPVLKEAGVVDSGGQGLLEMLRGGYDAFLGKEVDYQAIEGVSSVRETTAHGACDQEITFGYCTEFLIMIDKPFDKKAENDVKGYLSDIGDSLVCVADDDIVKIHVHTNDPGLAIQKGLEYGQLSRLKIDNMREEHNERLIRDAEKIAAKEKQMEKKEEPRKPIGFIVVSAGDGLDNVFGELGADYIIKGGQTMNPSTEDMLNAVEQVHADSVLIFPNNKNIILAAEQARNLTEDKMVYVIPTTTIPQGITALIGFDPGVDARTNAETMNEEIQHVKTGQVTYAVRDTCIDEHEIKQGDIMGIDDDGIKSVGKDITETTAELLASMVGEDDELISIYYGEDVSENDAQAFADGVSEQYPDLDVDVHYGGQPIYYYVLAVE